MPAVEANNTHHQSTDNFGALRIHPINPMALGLISNAYSLNL